MSGWIAIKDDLYADLRVKQIAMCLGVTEFHVIGCLGRLWLYAHAQGDAEGELDIRVTGDARLINALADHPKFFDELKSHGWLKMHETIPNAIVFPKLRRQFPDKKTAKERAKDKEASAQNRNARQSRWRNDEKVIVTPALVAAKLRQGVTEGQLRSWGWLKPGQSAQDYFAERGVNPELVA